MKRIAGLFNLDLTPVRPEEICRMASALALPERDARETWVKAGVGLAGVRTGNARAVPGVPLLACSSSQQVVVAFDGRIDNRPDLLSVLRAQLEGRSATVGDEDLLLAAYRRWGLECPARLTGDFAFALWDGDNHRLVCARDHFGVKPFYFHLSPHFFVFASTPRAILACGRVPVRVNEERIADFLVNPLEGIDKSSSFYANVFRLPPAHMLVVQPGGSSMQRYWELSPVPGPGLGTETEYIEAFQELFTAAIRCRLQDTCIPASMLSGGMDSSAIVAVGRKILAEEGRHPLHAFAVISNPPHKNRETAHITSVLDLDAIKPHLISETELVQRMDELVRAIEGEAEPFDCLMNLNRSVYLHARDQEVDALLDGIDGDVLLSGSGHLNQLWRSGAFGQTIGETLKAEGLIAEYKMGRKLFFSSFLSTLALAAPGWMRKLRRAARYRSAVDSAVEETIINREFATRSCLGERFARLDAQSPRPVTSTQTEFHKIALEHPFLTVGLERYERVASSFGIEARHPFTDVRLAEFCLCLPWRLKTYHGWTKTILRRALEPCLPPQVIWRNDKDSLMWEVNRLILKERAEYFYQCTCDEQANLEAYVDMHKLTKCWHEYLSLGDEKHSELIWSGVSLAMWLRNQRKVKANLN